MAPFPANADWRYRALIATLSPLLAGATLWQAVQAGDSRMARQRLGLGLPRRTDRPVWLHMSSVGEVNAAKPLVAALRRRRPDLPILVSTFTPTGAATALQLFGPGIEHVYLPLDFRHAVQRFLRSIRPRCALIMETEIWPQLFHQCRADGIPLLIINGRISKRTLDRPGWIRRFLAEALRNADRILARSETDAQRFIALGAAADRVEVIDNIKFARPAAGAGAPAPILLPRPYVVAASTHDDEELRLSRAWLSSHLGDTRLLVIVPRHPKRKTAIVQQLRPIIGDRLAVRSDNDRVSADTRVYLADTFGELTGFIAGSELVFIGGSLAPRGGQNIIEAARLGKVALFGPHMEHFADERVLLLAHEAAIEVADAEELIKQIAGLLADPERLEAIGRRARLAVDAKGDVAERYLDAVSPYIMR